MSLARRKGIYRCPRSLRIGALLVAFFALAAVEVGCSGNDDAGPTGRIVLGGSPDVRLVQAADGKVELLRVDEDEFWDVAFSADGALVAISPAPGPNANLGIALKDLSSGSLTEIPNQPPEEQFESYDLALAPDERSIAFVNGDGVFAISVDGTDLRKVGRGSSPGWTPDSEHIVFAAGDNRGDELDIAVIRADGTDLRLLGRGLYPDVSPSGDEVAYSTGTGVFVRPLAGGTPAWSYRTASGPCGHRMASSSLSLVTRTAAQATDHVAAGSLSCRLRGESRVPSDLSKATQLRPETGSRDHLL